VYELTDAGLSLQAVCDALGAWGAQWLELTPVHLDAGTVLWSMCKCMDRELLPDPRIVVRFEFSDGQIQRLWVVAKPPKPEVCVKPPGFDEDLVVRSDCESLARWQLGQLSLGHAQRAGLIKLEGPVHVQRELASWGARHQFAHIRPAREAAAAVSSDALF
jgi:hypothetical protein